MAFIGEVEEAAGDVSQLSCLKSFHPLVDRNAEIKAAVDHQNGCRPILYIVARIEARVAFGIGLFPIRSLQVPVGKEHFLGTPIPALQIEQAAVGNQRLEAIFVDASEHVHAVAAITRTHSSQTLIVHKGSFATSSMADR